jgi:outer membrane murein-binding lipoprotein Lpp
MPQETKSPPRPTLRELSAASRDLSAKIRELTAQRDAVDAAISARHERIRRVKRLAKASPEDVDAMLDT